jgi:hypothetical protein
VSPFRLTKDIPTLMFGTLGWPPIDHVCDWLDANLGGAEVRSHKLWISNRLRRSANLANLFRPPVAPVEGMHGNTRKRAVSGE